jgi:CRP/FNR family transcriptional regulator
MSWIEQISGLEDLSDTLRDQLVAHAKPVKLREGDLIFGPEKTPENLLLLLEGTIRVLQLSADGREIVLFRASGGESCVMTTACLLAYEDYSAEGRAETDIEAMAVPRHFFEDLVSTSKDFRRFMFQAYSKRIADLFLTIEEIAFKRMDVRLAQRLLELDPGTGVIKHTHSQLATELGTAREVISRQLREFQRRSWVRVGRGSVELTNVAELTGLVENA